LKLAGVVQDKIRGEHDVGERIWWRRWWHIRHVGII
jgi:hypothetical protein